MLNNNYNGGEFNMSNEQGNSKNQGANSSSKGNEQFKFDANYNYKGVITKGIIKVAKESRRISRDDGLAEYIDKFIYMVNKFNAIKEDTYQFQFGDDGEYVNVSELIIPHEFSFLLTPLSVRINPLDLKTKNLVKIPEYEVQYREMPFKSLLEYRTAIHGMRRYFKLDGNSDIDKVMDLRKHLSLFDVIPKACWTEEVDESHLLKSKLPDYGEWYWPIFLNGELSKLLFYDAYNNNTFENMAKNYLLKLQFYS